MAMVWQAAPWRTGDAPDMLNVLQCTYLTLEKMLHECVPAKASRPPRLHRNDRNAPSTTALPRGSALRAEVRPDARALFPIF
jgi:hypothetical protein